MINRRFMGLPLTIWTRVIFTSGPAEAYHGDVPLEDGLRPTRFHLKPSDVRIREIFCFCGSYGLILQDRGQPGSCRLFAFIGGIELGLCCLRVREGELCFKARADCG